MKEELKLKVIPYDPEELDLTWGHMIRDELLRRTVGQAKRVLDVGCGQGDVLLALSKQIGRGVGMDKSEGEVAAAERKRKKRRIKNLKFLRANALNIPFPSNTFDVVLCLGEVLQYVYGKEDRVLSEIKRVLKRGGLTVHGCANWDVEFIDGPSWSYFLRTKDGRFHFSRKKRTAAGLETGPSYEVLPDTPLHHWILKQEWPFCPGHNTSLDIVEEKPIPRKWLKFRRIGKNLYHTPRSLKRRHRKAGFRDVEVFPYGGTYGIVTKAGLLDTAGPSKAKFMARLARAEAETILKYRMGTGGELFLTARK
jgi:ubiquinone/menaquinone biosynthesis C-methylase UbiE